MNIGTPGMILEMPVRRIVDQRCSGVEHRRVHTVPGHRAAQVGILEVIHVISALPDHFGKLIHAVTRGIHPGFQAVVLGALRVGLHVIHRINGDTLVGDLLKGMDWR